jgi:beta-xylosidase
MFGTFMGTTPTRRKRDSAGKPATHSCPLLEKVEFQISMIKNKLRCSLWMITSLALLTSGLPRSIGQQRKVPFSNPILFSDYSDPDVIRDGKHYYLVSSTFSFVPGIPILDSTDLVHWKIIAHAVQRLNMSPIYDLTADSNGYGKGVWAPAIRKHNGLFYIYFPTPTEGIYVTTAARITGPWSEPVAVIREAGLEDPCPLWDDDGQAYLIHSRKGAGPLILHRMSEDGMKVLDEGKEIVRDPINLKTLEGPKLYKRNGWYYIFAPFGGVSTGSEIVLRSKSIYGPYERKVVLQQGDTNINGPHQGGWVETPEGLGWFLHFQSRGAHGRILHLEPVQWQDDWPVMGENGQPVTKGDVTIRDVSSSLSKPQTSDEFNSARLGQQWEWNHNPEPGWSLTERRGFLRLHPTQAKDLMTARNTLTQQMQDETFIFTVKLDLSHMGEGVHTGIAMLDQSLSSLEIVWHEGERTLRYHSNDSEIAGPKLPANVLQLRLRVVKDEVEYLYSFDEGRHFTALGAKTKIFFSWWKGSRPALFAYDTSTEANPGYIDFDWVRYQPEP